MTVNDPLGTPLVSPSFGNSDGLDLAVSPPPVILDKADAGPSLGATPVLTSAGPTLSPTWSGPTSRPVPADAPQRPDSWGGSGFPPPAAPWTTRPELRLHTIVWGLIVLAGGVVLLAAIAGARMDPTVVAISFLAAAGLALILGSIGVSLRRARRGDPPA